MAGLKNGDIITGPSGEQTQLFFQAATPTADVANALWYQTSTGIEYEWRGSAWVDVKQLSFQEKTTAPTTRLDGSALVEGDRWYKPTDNGVAGTAGLWIRRGIIWVTSYIHSHENGALNSLTNVNTAIITSGGDFTGTFLSADLRGIPFTFNTSIYLDTFSLIILTSNITGSNFSVSNSFELWPSLAHNSNTDAFAVTVDSLSKIAEPGPSNTTSNWTLNSTVDLSLLPNVIRPGIYVRNKVGTPAFTGTGNLQMFFSINIRGIHP